MDKLEVPIFFDDRGHRWKKIRLALLVVLLVVAAFAYFTIPRIIKPNPVTPLAVASTPGDAKITDTSSGLTPAEIAAVVGRTNTPIIGKGPLVRVVHIESDDSKNVQYATPVYSKTGAMALTNEERLAIGDHEFAIQRYGQSTVAKQIALTFDDGPDPTYTPRVLDMLARYKAQATFFVTGDNVVKHPDIAKRIANEGHLIANHSFNHIDFDFVDGFRGEQEISQTNRVITAATGTRSSFFRLPYMGPDEQSMRNHLLGILTAQNQGYVIASNDFDSDDWSFATGAKQILPTLDGTSQVILMHDAGGDRSQTVAYAEKIIKEAKAKGYKLVSLSQMYPQSAPLYAAVSPSVADHTALALASSYLVWPRAIVGKLFFLTVAMLFLTMIVNVMLAIYNMRTTRYGRRPRGYDPLVSVVISAYNEEKVLASTVRSILESSYRNMEVVIVDDGSKDKTGEVGADLARRYKKVRSFTKQNGGKSSGLNYGIRRANGEIIIGIDADTVFLPSTVTRLIRHFADPEVGAVAGNVKVGNIQNIITRWQMLDYIIGINIERNAQAALGAVLIVPGACGAWRKSVVLAAGGYKHVTLAEDFDLTLSVHRLGYKVLQDNSAVSYTEAPDHIKALTKQRFRWLYGTTQAFWKHRDMMLRRRYGWVGMFIMPLSIFNVLLPIVFIPILMIINIENILAGNFKTVIVFFLATVSMQAIMATIGVILAGEDKRHLLAIPFTRLVYSPIRTLLLYRVVFSAIRGVSVGWNKLQRTGAVLDGKSASQKVRVQLATSSAVDHD